MVIDRSPNTRQSWSKQIFSRNSGSWCCIDVLHWAIKWSLSKHRKRPFSPDFNDIIPSEFFSTPNTTLSFNSRWWRYATVATTRSCASTAKSFWLAIERIAVGRVVNFLKRIKWNNFTTTQQLLWLSEEFIFGSQCRAFLIKAIRDICVATLRNQFPNSQLLSWRDPKPELAFSLSCHRPCIAFCAFVECSLKTNEIKWCNGKGIRRIILWYLWFSCRPCTWTSDPDWRLRPRCQCVLKMSKWFLYSVSCELMLIQVTGNREVQKLAKPSFLDFLRKFLTFWEYFFPINVTNFINFFGDFWGNFLHRFRSRQHAFQGQCVLYFLVPVCIVQFSDHLPVRTAFQINC